MSTSGLFTTQTPTAQAIPRADGAGHIDPAWLVRGDLTVPSSIFGISGNTNSVFGAGAAISLATQSANLVWAGPTSGSAATPTFRSLVSGDIPDLSGTYLVRANNLSDLINAGTARTNLGGTTVGQAFFTLTNPSAITFPRINADNSVSALDAASFRTAIGAGTGSGTVTSVSVVTANGVSGTVATATTTPAITLTLGAITPTSVSTGALTSSSLTAGRVTFAGTSGLLTDDADMTFATDTLTVTKGTFGGITHISNAIAAANSVTSVAGQALILATGTTGTALTFASATNNATFVSSGTFTNDSGGCSVYATVAGTPRIRLTNSTSGKQGTISVESGDSDYMYFGAPSGTGLRLRVGSVDAFNSSATAGNFPTVTVNFANATSASSATVGAVTIGNGTAATNVAIGGGNVNAGGVITAPSFVGALTGNANTATALQTGRTINGTTFDGTANITVTAAAGTLTGTTLNATVVTSSLTAVGTIATGTWQGTAIATTYGGMNTGGTTGQVLAKNSNSDYDLVWSSAGTGTVTSVAMTVPAFLSIAGSPITTSGTLAVTLSGTALPVANGGTGATTLASNGVLYGNGTSAILALAVNSTATNKFLTQSSSGAPAWATIVSGDVPNLGANPSASVGLAAVNGSATTYLRSDGAPALSQSIVPTWTGLHTFTASLTMSGSSHQTLSIISTSGTTNAARVSFQNTAQQWYAGILAGSTDGFAIRDVTNAITSLLIDPATGVITVAGKIVLPNSVSLATTGTGGGVNATLLCDSSNDIRLQNLNATNLLLLTNGTTRVTISGAGAVQFNAYGAGAATFDASGNITSVSDETMKTGILPSGYGLKELHGFKPIIFNYHQKSGLDTKSRYGGWGAQSVLPFIPEAVGMNRDGTRSLNPWPIVGAIQNAVIEIDSRLTKLELAASQAKS